MSTDSLSKLAKAAGIALDWEDIAGVARRVTPQSARAILTALGHPCDTEGECRESLSKLTHAVAPKRLVVEAGQDFRLPIEAAKARLVLESGETRRLDLIRGPAGVTARGVSVLGYHQLEIDGAKVELAVCPPRCLTIGERLGRRAWGLAAQLYSLPGPGAFGDFGDLARLAQAAAAVGADALAVSPTHALFAADASAYSPYSPSSRDQLNGLYASLSALEPSSIPQVQSALIDWLTAAPQKTRALREALATTETDPRRAAFVEAGGEPLRRHALFEALHGYFRDTQGVSDWRAWPAPFQDPARAEAAARSPELQAEVAFHMGVQWAADLSLQQAQAVALERGIGLGLISDLAVGLSPSGAHAWAYPDELLKGLTLGAPPDAFQAKGQGWGITSFSPEALRRTGFDPFLRTLRSALKHAGGVRIDHALGLKRLWVLPEGASPLEGAYLDAPFEDLLRLLALESHRANAVVIGEDLGVVPPGLRDALEQHAVLGMQVLPFEQEEGQPRAPQTWRKRAVGLTSTHDLSPLGGWWVGTDLTWRRHLDPDFDLKAGQDERDVARANFWAAAKMAGVTSGPQPSAETPGPAIDAAIAYVAATPCELVLFPLEDLFGEIEAVNLPGVVDEHPNWRRRYLSPITTLFAAPDVARRLAGLRAERPK